MAYVKHGDDTWALVRESYLAGATAPELSRRYGVTRDAIYRRASRDGWTKATVANAREGASGARPAPATDAEALAAEAAAPDKESGIDPARLAREALTRARPALAAGAVTEAERLVRIARALSGLIPPADAVDAQHGASNGDRESAADDVIARIERAAAAAEIRAYTSAWAKIAASLGVRADADALFAAELSALDDDA